MTQLKLIICMCQLYMLFKQHSSLCFNISIYAFIKCIYPLEMYVSLNDHTLLNFFSGNRKHNLIQPTGRMIRPQLKAQNLESQIGQDSEIPDRSFPDRELESEVMAPQA